MFYKVKITIFDSIENVYNYVYYICMISKVAILKKSVLIARADFFRSDYQMNNYWNKYSIELKGVFLSFFIIKVKMKIIAFFIS